MTAQKDTVAKCNKDALAIIGEQLHANAASTFEGAPMCEEVAGGSYRASLQDLTERFSGNEDTETYHVYWFGLPTDCLMQEVLGPDVRKMPQHGNDLAEQLLNVCRDIAAAGYDRLLIVGANSPQLSLAIVRQGFRALDSRDVVVGAAEDGGYYLVGLRLLPEPPNLFEGIHMQPAPPSAFRTNHAHTSTLLAETLVRAADLDCSISLLTMAADG